MPRSRDPIRTVVFASIDPEAGEGSGFALPSLDAALASSAAAVIVDLEDTTAAHRKPVVREGLAMLDGVGPRLWVRINEVGSPTWHDDLEAAAAVASTILVPKISDADQVELVDRALTELGSAAEVVALVETASGMIALPSICRAAPERLRTVLLGMGDLTRDMGVTYTGMGEIENYARCRVVEACAAAGLAPPIDTAALVIGDREFFLREAELGRRMGFGGKCCLALDEVEMAAAVFRPTIEELSRARAIVTAFIAAQREGRGILTVGGALVDAPVARRAAAVLQEAGEDVEI